MQKYKVFLNEKRILFTSFSKITFREPISNLHDFNDELIVKNWLDEFVKSKEEEALFESDEPQKAFDDFRNALTEVQAAGGVVKRNGELLFIFRNGKWDLPKGKIDVGETPRQAALREVGEECGISGHHIVEELPTTYHIYQSPCKSNTGEWIFKPTFWFEMEYSGIHHGEPQIEEGISKLKWISCNQLSEAWENTYGNLKQLLQIYR